MFHVYKDFEKRLNNLEFICQDWYIDIEIGIVCNKSTYINIIDKEQIIKNLGTSEEKEENLWFASI